MTTPETTIQIRPISYQQVREPQVIEGPAVVRTSTDAAAIFRHYLGSPDREHIVALALNTAHAPTGLHTVSIGGLSSAPMHPREVFAFAIEQRAAAVILGHNHPSGTLTASTDDILITEQMRAAGKLLGIELLDHIIVTDAGYVSLRETRQGFS